MPELLIVRFEMGREASTSAVARAFADLDVVCESAVSIATRSAERAAERYLGDLMAQEGPRGLISQARRLELSRNDLLERDLAWLEQEAEEFEMFLREWGPPFFPRRTKRGRYAAFLPALFAPTPGNPLSGTAWQSVYQELLAAETIGRLPTDEYRFRALRYENPVFAEILAGTGTAVAALGYLLRVLTTLGPRRRREVARADAEERIQEANARDVEDRVECRMALRRLLLEGIRRGEVDLRPEDITEAFLDKIEGAGQRLADREIVFERHQEIEGG